MFAVNPCVYMEITMKPVYIHDYELKTRVQEERCTKKVNRQDKTNFTPIRHYQANMPPDPTQKQEKKEQFEVIEC